jgi:hypothetical protein
MQRCSMQKAEQAVRLPRFEIDSRKMLFYTTNALGYFAFGRAVLDVCWRSVFPRGARKNRTQRMGSSFV